MREKPPAQGRRVETAETQTHFQPFKRPGAPNPPPRNPNGGQAQGASQQQRPRQAVNVQAVDVQPEASDMAAAALNAQLGLGPSGGAQTQKRLSEQSSLYTVVDLPSKFHWYLFAELPIRKLLAADQAKLNRSAKEQRLRHMVDAISATLGGNLSAYDLSIPDFYWILYWQRLNSFTRAPFVHRAICDNEQHLEDVYINNTKTIESLRISEVVNKSTLRDTVFDPATLPFTEIDGHELWMATMRDSVEIDEIPADDPNRSETVWLYDYAAYLKPTRPGQTLAERSAVISRLTPDQLDQMDAYIEAAANYGVVETVKLKCKECGADVVTTVTIDALDFLPTSQRSGSA